MKPISSNGFSLIEVLIAIFVLALGVIGAAGLQLAAIRTSQQSGAQTVAVQIANELADKMRTNSAQMKLPDSVNLFTLINYNSLVDPNPTAPVMCYGAAASCSASDLAAADIYEMLVRVKRDLPGGRIKLCRDSAPYSSANASLTWTCTNDPNAGVTIKIGWKSKNPDGSFNDNAGVIPPSVALTVESYVK